MVNFPARACDISTLQVFYEAVTFTPAEYQAYKMRELLNNKEKLQAAIEAQRQALFAELAHQHRMRVQQQEAQIEAAKRARFGAVQDKFGTAIALLDRARWNLRNFSPGEMNYLMQCAQKVRSLTFTGCRLPENFGSTIAAVFPRLRILNVRRTNFNDGDLEALQRNVPDVSIDYRNSRVRFKRSSNYMD